MRAALPSARMRSDFAIRRCRASKASISAAGAICRSPFSAPGTDRDGAGRASEGARAGNAFSAQSVAGSIRTVGRLAPPQAAHAAAIAARLVDARAMDRDFAAHDRRRDLRLCSLRTAPPPLNSKRLPHILVEISNWLTRFRQVAMVPVAVGIVARGLRARRNVARADTHAASRTGGDRGARRNSCSSPSPCPGSSTADHQAHRRPRAAAGHRLAHSASVHVHAVHDGKGDFNSHAVGARDRRGFGRHRARRALAESAALSVGLRHLHLHQPRHRPVTSCQ